MVLGEIEVRLSTNARLLRSLGEDVDAGKAVGMDGMHVRHVVIDNAVAVTSLALDLARKPRPQQGFSAGAPPPRRHHRPLACAAEPHMIRTIAATQQRARPAFRSAIAGPQTCQPVRFQGCRQIMSNDSEFLWYIPNDTRPGHRGDDAVENHNSLATLTEHARALEEHGWKGALIGTGWGRPDTFTVATALAASTRTFEPLIAIRPGYWRPANFASAAATLDHLTGGRVRVNIVSGLDNLAAYGDQEGDQARATAAPRSSCGWSAGFGPKENVNHDGEHFAVSESTVMPRIETNGAVVTRKLFWWRLCRRPKTSQRRRRIFSCFGASRWTVCGNASRGSRR